MRGPPTRTRLLGSVLDRAGVWRVRNDSLGGDAPNQEATTGAAGSGPAGLGRGQRRERRKRSVHRRRNCRKADPAGTTQRRGSAAGRPPSGADCGTTDGGLKGGKPWSRHRAPPTGGGLSPAGWHRAAGAATNHGDSTRKRVSTRQARGGGSRALKERQPPPTWSECGTLRPTPPVRRTPTSAEPVVPPLSMCAARLYARILTFLSRGRYEDGYEEESETSSYAFPSSARAWQR